MNQNPYLNWAKQIRWAMTYGFISNPFELLKKPISLKRPTYAGLPASYTSTREVIAALADAEADAINKRSDRLDAIELASFAAIWPEVAGMPPTTQRQVSQILESNGFKCEVHRVIGDEILLTATKV